MSSPEHPGEGDTGRVDSAGREFLDTNAEESEKDRLNRKWNEILQELRVTQTGTQIISGFLLTLPFQSRFADLTGTQVAVYLVLVSVAAIATTVGLGPVGLHRALFGRHTKDRTVEIGHRLLMMTIGLVALLAAGVVFFIFEVVVGLVAGIVAGCMIFVILVTVLLVIPRTARTGGQQR